MNYKDIEGWFNMEKQYLELLDLTPEQGIFVELGAYKGKSTYFIVSEIIKQGRTVKFYTVDTFKGDSGSLDNKEVEAYKKVNISKLYEEFKANTASLEEYFITIVDRSDSAANYFVDESVDNLFIDAGHSYEAVVKDIQAWLPKMKKGGTMAGHDYAGWEGVGKAVMELLGTPDKVENDCWFKKIK